MAEEAGTVGYVVQKRDLETGLETRTEVEREYGEKSDMKAPEMGLEQKHSHDQISCHLRDVNPVRLKVLALGQKWNYMISNFGVHLHWVDAFYMLDVVSVFRPDLILGIIHPFLF